MQSITIKNKVVAISLLALVAAISLVFIKKAQANPSFLPAPVASASATSSVQYLRFNTTSATSTPLVYDTYCSDSTGSSSTSFCNNYATNKAALKLYVTASSTATIYKVDLEYSDGAPNVSCVTTPLNCDWYQDNLTLDATAGASEAIATANSYSWTYASTTVGGAAITASTNTGSKIMYVNTPTRYVRAIISIAGANGAFWAAIQPVKEMHE